MAAALAAGDLGAVVRLVRRAHAMTQTDLGNLLHVSASTISRLENGRQPLTNTTILKLLAEHLSIPPHILGLAPEPRNAVITTTAAPATVSAVSVGTDAGDGDESGDEAVRRRQLLADLAAAAGATALAPKMLTASAARAAAADDPGALLVTRIEDVLIGPHPDAAPMTLPVLRGTLSSVVGNFQACRYAHLADQLPRLVAAAEATYEHASGIERQDAAAMLAQTYNVTTRMLIKLDENHIAWISGDRARSAAAATGGNALTFAEATRNLCILTRTAGRHERARDLAIDAAERLDISGGRGREADRRHLSQYGLLYSTAGYSAAKTGDRTESKQLLDEAAAAAGRLTSDSGNHWMGFGTSGVWLYRISSALVLGDAGTAIDHARHVHPAELPTVERRARYWVDVARAFAMWGKHDHCYRALLAAEQAAPEETRSLPVVRTLVQTLATNTHQAAAPGLREFAARVHAPI